jgi:signal transduction histidine kinase
MRMFVAFVSAVFGVVALTAGALAGAQGTPDEAKALVVRAAELLKSDGKDKAFAAFNNPTGAFVDRDLYVFVLSHEGVTVSHGANAALIGKNLSAVKDADGKPFIQEMIAIGKSGGEGWVDYKWSNPTTKKLEAKSSFVKAVGDVLVGVGVYKG